MRDVLSFSIPGSNTVHQLKLGFSLIRFAEFDLKFFRDQCVETYRKEGDSGILEKAGALKEYLRNCHPYCGALLNTEFDKIVLDCIIENICIKENIGLEELWVRNITAPNRFGEATFKRITEYKAGLAINQWTNLQRMQAYAISKMSVIYGDDETDIHVHKARKHYYDTAFMMTASALGLTSEDLPKARVFNIALSPLSHILMKNAVNTIEPIIAPMTEGIKIKPPLKGNACVQDQIAGMALKVMAGLRRPEVEEIRQMIQMYSALPDLVYEPECFKAIIDLEFGLLIANGYYLRFDQKTCTYTRVKYAPKKEPVTKQAPDEPEIESVHNKTEAYEKPLDKNLEAEEAEEKNETFNAQDGEGTGVINAALDMEKPITGKVRTIIQMAEDPNRKLTKVRTLQEVNLRCNLIWMSMNIRTDWSGTAETEVSEWFRYLTRLRYGIGTNELPLEALDKFLDATQEVFRFLPENEY